MNLRRNSVTCQIPFGFEMASRENQWAIFYSMIHIGWIKNTLTIQPIIDMSKSTFEKKEEDATGQKDGRR
jgi:hypothetical protein